MSERTEALVLGLGNVLWADEGFGVRAIEALNAAYAFPEAVTLMDGGTQGLYLYGCVTASRCVLVLDAIDFGLPPGTLRVLRGEEVPAWAATKLSPHQVGFNDILALAQMNGSAPESVVVIGVQPVELNDFGGSLREPVRARLPEAVEQAARELATWGFPGTPRPAGSPVPALNAAALAIEDYEGGRPSEAEACRTGDERVLAQNPRGGT